MWFSLSADDNASHGSHVSRDAPAPENPEVQKSISALLTPYLAAKLSRGEDSHQVNTSDRLMNTLILHGIIDIELLLEKQ